MMRSVVGTETKMRKSLLGDNETYVRGFNGSSGGSEVNIRTKKRVGSQN